MGISHKSSSLTSASYMITSCMSQPYYYAQEAFWFSFFTQMMIIHLKRIASPSTPTSNLSAQAEMD